MLGPRMFAKSKHLFGSSFLSMNPNNILRFSATSSLHSSQKTNFARAKLFDLCSLDCNSPISFSLNSKGGDLLEQTEEMKQMEELRKRVVESLFDLGSASLNKIATIETLPNTETLVLGRSKW